MSSDYQNQQYQDNQQDYYDPSYPPPSPAKPKNNSLKKFFNTFSVTVWIVFFAIVIFALFSGFYVGCGCSSVPEACAQSSYDTSTGCF